MPGLLRKLLKRAPIWILTLVVFLFSMGSLPMQETFGFCFRPDEGVSVQSASHPCCPLETQSKSKAQTKAQGDGDHGPVAHSASPSGQDCEHCLDIPMTRLPDAQASSHASLGAVAAPSPSWCGSTALDARLAPLGHVPDTVERHPRLLALSSVILLI